MTLLPAGAGATQERYNGLPSVEIQGKAAPGKSTGEAMALMEQLAGKLPMGIGYDWTGMSYQERLSGNHAPSLYAISLIVVFLIAWRPCMRAGLFRSRSCWWYCWGYRRPAGGDGYAV